MMAIRLRQFAVAELEPLSGPEASERVRTAGQALAPQRRAALPAEVWGQALALERRPFPEWRPARAPRQVSAWQLVSELVWASATPAVQVAESAPEEVLALVQASA